MPYYESDPLVYAIDGNGTRVHVDAVPNGSACGCVCPACKQPLVAKNGGRKLVHHFAHRKGACAWAVEASMTMTVYDILQKRDTLEVEGASYYDHEQGVYRALPPDGTLAIAALSLVEAKGRQAPIILVDCKGPNGQASPFYFVTVVTHPFTGENIQDLGTGETPVLALDFKKVYAGLRDEYGRHFSRGEFFYRIQDPEYLGGILPGKEAAATDALCWIHHPAAERAEREANQRWHRKLQEEREAEERRLEAERRRWEAEREAVERRLEAEREAQRLEEERQRTQDLLDAAEREKQHFESQGVETLPIVRKGVHFFADGCPLHGQANIATDCGDFAFSQNKCVFFEGRGYQFIGCTARQNGVGLDED